MTDLETMRIGEVAEQTSLSLRTLRHYEDIGLVIPSARTDGGFRLYTERDVARLLIVRRMKPLGYTLEEMSALLRVVDDLERDESPELRSRLTEIREEARLRREQLAARVDMADEFLARLDDI
ncbi:MULTISPECIES: MerR family transcriptional regulator [unclassified Microbacterium]|uniref:MerR family transcriptional regulator n=1 Tax=unclassified Microbacterium TaxID=2609290 RepID=UPI000EA8A580|nr:MULTISPECIES: MerR family transcriptional regulator [unclassified Microbacterium]RKN67336.1 MerR family transcriptional regulator [Microbacterium sp. CGR2]